MFVYMHTKLAARTPERTKPCCARFIMCYTPSHRSVSCAGVAELGYIYLHFVPTLMLALCVQCTISYWFAKLQKVFIFFYSSSEHEGMISMIGMIMALFSRYKSRGYSVTPDFFRATNDFFRATPDFFRETTILLAIGHAKWYNNHFINITKKLMDTTTTTELEVQNKKSIAKHNYITGVQRVLDRDEEKFLNLLLTNLYQGTEFKPDIDYTIDTRAWADHLGLSEHTTRIFLRENFEKMQKSAVKFQVSTNEKISMSLIQRITYNTVSGEISVRFTADGVRVLSGTQVPSSFIRKCGFVTLPHTVNQYKCKYSSFMLELAKKHLRRGTFTLNVRELREMFNVDENKYSVFTYFRNKVLVPAVNEIHANEDMYIEFEIKKNGHRAVQEVTFTVCSWDTMKGRKILVDENGESLCGREKEFACV